MSRSDHTFPSYIKIDLDPDKPKAGWDSGCRRCSKCSMSWPNVPVFSPSPCHNVAAGIVKSAKPEMSWHDAVLALFKARFDKYYEKWNEGLSDEELYWTNTESKVSDAEISEGMKEIEKMISEEHHARADR